MDTLEYMKLVCGILTVIITYGGFRMYTDRRKYIQEVEKLKAEVRDAQVNTRGSELDNVQKAMQILMDEIVEPLKQEINAIRKELGKLRRAVEKSKSPKRLEKTTSLDSLYSARGFVLIQQPVPPSIAKTVFLAGTLKSIPIGTGFSTRSGQATVNVTRVSEDSVEVRATCDSLAREVIYLREELTRIRNETGEEVEEPPPQIVKEPTGWQWFQIWTGRMAVAVLVLIVIKRRLKRN